MARSNQYPPSVDPGAPIEPPIPEGWQRFTFRELLDVVERPVVLDDDREYQLVNAKRSRGGVSPRERLRGRDIRVKSQFRIETDDFLISKRQIIHGACGVVPKDLAGSIVSNEYVALRPKPSLDINYLQHLSFTPYFQRTCFHSSVGVDVEKMVFKLEQWLRYSIPIPPLPEQHQIAAILSSVDETIEKTHSVIGQLEAVKKGLLEELLTRGMPGQHKKLIKSEVGLLPSGWQCVRLGDLVVDSRYGTSTKCSSDAAGLPVLRIPNILGGRIDTTDLKYARLPSAEVARLALRKGDLLVVRTNGNPDYVGRLAVVTEAQQGWLYASYLIRLRLSGKAMPAFIRLALESPPVRRLLARVTRTSAGNYNLNSEGLAGTLVPVPPIDEQTAIVEFVNSVQDRIDVETAALEQSLSVKHALLDALLSGKIRISASAQEAV